MRLVVPHIPRVYHAQTVYTIGCTGCVTGGIYHRVYRVCNGWYIPQGVHRVGYTQGGTYASLLYYPGTMVGM